MSRMKILNAVEQEQFESPPVFNSVQRKQYFDFSSELLTLAQDLQTPTNQVCFLVSCGYFKAAKRFFPNRRCSRRDLDYVAQKLGFQPESIDVNSYSATTRLRHERLILDFYGFRPFDSAARKFVTGEIEKLARSQLQPALILWRIVDNLVKEKIEIPGYYPLAELILAAVNARKAELRAIIDRALTARNREALDELLVQGSAAEDEPVPTKTAAYKLTLLKKLSQSTRPSKIKETITDLLVVQGLYRDFLPILCALDLNHEGVRYYAHSVIKSEIFQVTRRSSKDRYLHLIAFVTHQYFRLQDNLLDVLVNVLRSWRSFPLSIATAVSSMSFGTGSSGIIGRNHRKRRFTQALLVWAAESAPGKSLGFPGRSVSQNLRIRLIGTSHPTRPRQLTTRYSI
jgi:Domain of unknown function (DUF4158)